MRAFLLRLARLCVATLITAGLLIAAAAEGQPEFPGFEIERTESLTQLSPGAAAEVSNLFGDVRLRFGGYEGVFEVRAVLQQFADEGPPLVVQVVEQEGRLRVTVGARAAESAELQTEPRKGQRKRADLVIFVPEKVKLEVSTAGGLVEARGLRGDLRARTRSGAIQVRSVTGDLDLESESGAIAAVPGALDHAGLQRFASTSGDIRIQLAETGHFTIEVKTGGFLSTDFSLTVEPDSTDLARKHGRARIGKGTIPIEIASVTGHVRLILRPSAANALITAPEGTP